MQGISSSAPLVSPAAVTACRVVRAIFGAEQFRSSPGRMARGCSRRAIKTKHSHRPPALRRRLLGEKCNFRISATPQASLLRLGISAGCGGGGKSLVPGGSSQQSLGQSVPVTFTVTIGSQSQTQSTKRSPQLYSEQHAVDRHRLYRRQSFGNARSRCDAACQRNDGRNRERDGNDDESTAGGRVLCEQRHLHVHDFAEICRLGSSICTCSRMRGKTGPASCSRAATSMIAQVNANGTVTQPGSTAPISIALIAKRRASRNCVARRN